MKKPLIVLLFILLALPVADAEEVSLGNMPKEVAVQLGQAYQMSGLSDIVRGKMGNKLSSVLKDKLQEFASEAFTEVATNGLPSGGRVDVRSLAAKMLGSGEKKSEIKAAIKEKLKKWLPEATKELVEKELLNGQLLETETVAEMRQIEEKIVSALNTTLDHEIDEIGEKVYAGAVSGLNEFLQPKGTARSFISVDVTDLKKTFSSAFNMQNVARAVSLPLASAFGESTVKGIRSRLETAFNGQLPPEAIQYLRMGPDKFAEYASKLKEFLPGEQLNELVNNVKSKVLNMPLMKLPNPPYCGVLAGVAAGHFATFLSSCGPWGCTRYDELTRGVEVTRVLQWQAANKNSVTLTLANFLDMAKVIGSKYGLDKLDAVTKIRADIGALGDRLKKMKELADKMDEMVKQPLDRIGGRLNDAAAALQGELVNLQNDLLQPLRDARNGLEAGLQEIRDEFGSALGDINGLPSGFEELKERLGVPDDLLGSAGEFNPYKEGKELFDENVKKLLSPKPEIKEEEEIPAQNPSPSDENDAGDNSPFDPVMLHNGEFYLRAVDLTIPGRGLPFQLIRIYKSRGDFSGTLGHNWTHNYAEGLMSWTNSAGEKGMTWVNEGGNKYFFKEKGASGFVSPAGVFDILSRSGNDYILISPNGMRTVFDEHGLMISRRDRFGNELTFVYDKDARLSSVNDTLGREVRYLYDDVGRIVKVVDPLGRQFEYSYDKDGDLIGATSCGAKTTRYRYNEHKLSMIMDPKGRVYLRNTYGSSGENHGRVVSQVYGDDKYQITATYRGVPHAARDVNELFGRVWVKDKKGVTRIYEHNYLGNLLSSWIVLGKKRVEPVVRHRYDDNGLRLATYYPSGMSVIREYDERGNVQREHLCAGAGEKCRTSEYTYDLKFNDMTSARDPMGNVVRWEYDDRGALESEQAANGSVTRYQHDQFGRLTSETNAEGRVDEYTYVNGYLQSVVRDARGVKAETAFEYDGVGNVTAVKLPGGLRTEYGIDRYNRVETETAEGRSMIYTYDDNDSPTKIQAGPSSYEFVYDILGNIVLKRERVDDKAFIETRYAYDANENLIKVALPEGNYIRYEYDAEGRPIKMFRERSLEWEVARDLNGNITKITDGAGRATEYSYNGFGELIRAKDPFGAITTYERDALGRPVSRAISKEGKAYAESAVSYDALGNIVSARQKLWRDDPLKSKWLEERYVRDKVGEITEKIAANGAATKYSRDGMGRIVSMRDAMGNVLRATHDADGHLVKVEDEVLGRAVGYSYDTFGRLIAATDALNKVTTYDYDPAGDLVKVTGPMGFGTLYEYDLLGRRIASRQEVDKERRIVTRYEWDGNGRLSSITDDNGDKTSYSYDSSDRLVEEVFPNSRKASYSYDAAGRVKWVMDRMGRKIENVYDTKEDITERMMNGRMLQRFVRDPLGRLVYAFDDSGDVHSWFAYDSLSRLVGENQNGKWVVKNFDAVGNDTAIMYPSGSLYHRRFDPIGRLTSVSEPATGAVFAELKYKGHDAQLGLELGNKIALRREEDGKGRPIELSYASPTGKRLKEWRYGYNDADALVSDGEHEYAYDGAGRLIRADNEEWILDGIGNWKGRPDVARYDENGNMTSDGEFRYRYDELGRLTEVERADGAKIAIYSYDALNRRMQKVVNEKISSHYYDGWNLIAEDDREHIYGEGLDSVIGSKIGGEMYYYLKDRQNSVRAVSEAGGSIVATYDYGAYGNVLGGTDDKDGTEFRYVSRERDDETGLIYMRNRYYSPKLGRFITEDPLGYKNTFYSASTMLDLVSVSYHAGANGSMQPGLPYNLSYTGGVSDGPMPGPIYVGTYRTMQNRYAMEDMGLYRYALSNPFSYFDPLGLWSLYIDLDPNRSVEGVWSLVSDENVRIYEGGRALGRGLKTKDGGSRDWTQSGGNTPTGIYSFNGFLPSISPEQIEVYGRQDRMILEPISGNALTASQMFKRGSLRIHEGREGFFKKNGRLMNTGGCIRLSPDDMAKLNTAIRELKKGGDTEGKVFIDENVDHPTRGVAVMDGSNLL